MRVWIDLSNSPHPLLFHPIADRLEEEGAEVLVTVRDHAQTRELAARHWPDAEVIGLASPSSRPRKAQVLASRVVALARWARRSRPDVAVSHNSYAQITAARLSRIPVVTAMDYERQPANHLAFRLARRILVPTALPAETLARQGARPPRLVRYPGFKEQIYLTDFDPDPDILASLGIATVDGRRLAVVRAAPMGATYHRGENPVFERLVRDLGASGAYLTVVLARHREQQRAFADAVLPHTLVPEQAIDARSLLCAADLFVGAGGTMTREAALLGVPAFSVFAGPEPAVDRDLERRGMLTRIPASEAPLPAIEAALAGTAPTAPPSAARFGRLREEGETVIELFVRTILDPALLESTAA